MRYRPSIVVLAGHDGWTDHCVALVVLIDVWRQI
jgi:hypothetical protein